MTSAGGWDCFILKLDTTGNFVWANKIGGTSNDFSNISIDNFGYIYVSGFFHGNVDFDPGLPVYNMSTTSIHKKVFVTKWDAQANFVWAINMGGASNNGISKMVFDGANNIYATGVFDQTMNCDPSGGQHNVISNGLYDVYVLKLVQPPVGIKDESINNQELSLAPNPAVNYVSIEAKSKIKSARLLTVTGSVVMEQYNATGASAVFEVGALPTGIYFAEVVTDKGRVMRKWIKE
ncbi:MAG: T9SS type A sorting domain-containing protein [Bacteroidetes bacterium]|nr:T9SS type A sorting domain-containing protein [Bacteroidota bacterium]